MQEPADGLAGGQHFSRGALYLMLRNRIYRGDIVHQGFIPGPAREAILNLELWQIVQNKLLRFIGRSVHWRWARSRRVRWPD